jgi:hypothetical protein
MHENPGLCLALPVVPPAGCSAQRTAAEPGPGVHHLFAAGGHQLGRAFERDLAGIDVVVGAKGSPMQLILSGVLHIDVPPGNVPLQAVRALEATPIGGQRHPDQPGRQF